MLDLLAGPRYGATLDVLLIRLNAIAKTAWQHPISSEMDRNGIGICRVQFELQRSEILFKIIKI